MSNKITYEYNNNLPFIKAGYSGNILVNGRFSRDINKKKTHVFKTLRWFIKKNPQKAHLLQEKAITKVEKIDHFKNNAIYWLGHSCFYINYKGITIITDPVFFDLLTNKRDTELPFNINDLKNIDYLLISHDHYDHLSIKSIKSLLKNSPNIKALLPLKTGALFKGINIDYEEAGWYQQYNTNENVKIWFLPSDHWCRRSIFDQNKRLWGSFLIDFHNIKIYFAGDTAYNSSMFQEINQVCGNMDICLMPIGSYSPAFMMKDHHTNPEEAAALFNILGGDKFIPMHYGTYTLSSEPASEPVNRIKKVVDKDKLEILNIGGVYDL